MASIATNHWGWGVHGISKWIKHAWATKPVTWGTEMHPDGEKVGDAKTYRPRIKMGPFVFGEFIGMALTDPINWKKVFGGYLKYVLRHKWFVFLECTKRGLVWRGITHDMSKFLPSEFVPYAMHFYGNIKQGRDETGYYKPTDTGDPAFDRAWFFHQKRNSHHWQYWVFPDDADSERALIVLDMPLADRTEMLCDWKGAGRAQGTPDTLAWYKKNREKIILGPATRDWVDQQTGYTKEY